MPVLHTQPRNRFEATAKLARRLAEGAAKAEQQINDTLKKASWASAKAGKK
ncbi:MAG TPA: hypothetical protein VFC44_25995 [Candidatus Saccharimonadales bacterium]|jgi:hypothetical protein|nr:hypothetical protein [Candidatus Saccharimonadales bacterium]